MKKNISINISGIIFHIEEDGYESLRKYLDTVNRYFSSFEDSSEILADIESRIAEIFLSKLNEGKQVITAEDVSSLIATMGSVNDFKAAEETDFAAGAPKEEPKKEQREPYVSPSRKLVRDRKRKILGGVCAGFGHYFGIDPIWPRLLFALLAIGSYGILILVYVLLWIVLPVSEALEDDVIKKMFRDKEKRVVGGVASGVAAFFGADVSLVRVLFVISAIFGVGFLVYIVLWIALPQANTITEKMQMQGEPLTLSNIETTVKKGLNEKDGEEENILTKIILFPFRAIAAILNGLGRILGPLFRVGIDILRVMIGLMIAFIGIGFILAIIVMGGLAAGLVSAGSLWGDASMIDLNIPLEAMRHTFPVWIALFGFLILLIPAIFVLLLGSSVIAKRLIISPLLGWSLFVLFFVSAIILSFTIPKIVYSFKEQGEFKTEKIFSSEQPVKRFTIHEVGLDDYDKPRITLHGHEHKDTKITFYFESQGPTRAMATANAQMVDYHVVQTDSVLTFDSNITFQKDAKFYAQDIRMDVYVPYDKPFSIDADLWRLIDTDVIFTQSYNYYSLNRETQTWKMTDKGLECMTCPPVTEEPARLDDFNSIELSGYLDVRIREGRDFKVVAENADDQDEHIYKDGETLIVDYSNEKRVTGNLAFNKRRRITIILPDLESLEFSGTGKLDIEGFNEEDLQVVLNGAVEAKGDFNARNLELDINGTSTLELRGDGNFLDASVNGASELSAYGYETNHAIVEASGTSSVKVNATQKLETTKGITSTISHRGNPKEKIEKD